MNLINRQPLLRACFHLFLTTFFTFALVGFFCLFSVFEKNQSAQVEYFEGAYETSYYRGIKTTNYVFHYYCQLKDSKLHVWFHEIAPDQRSPYQLGDTVILRCPRSLTEGALVQTRKYHENQKQIFGFACRLCLLTLLFIMEPHTLEKETSPYQKHALWKSKSKKNLLHQLKITQQILCMLLYVLWALGHCLYTAHLLGKNGFLLEFFLISAPLIYNLFKRYQALRRDYTFAQAYYRK